MVFFCLKNSLAYEREEVTALFGGKRDDNLFIFLKKVSQYFEFGLLLYECAAGWRCQFGDENLLKGV